MSHLGSCGESLSNRIERHGVLNRSFGENIIFENKSTIESLIFMIVDDGLSGKPNRKNIFDEDYLYIGIGYIKHKTLKHCYVLNFAEEFHEFT